MANPRRVFEFLRPLAREEEQECFWVLILDSKSRLRAAQEVTRGTLNSSLVHPREVFRAAVMMGAASIIVAHNHPSGDVHPSPEDREVTKRLVDAGRVLDIPVHDHVVVGDDKYYSFAESGWPT